MSDAVDPVAELITLVDVSAAANYRWKARGLAPKGYSRGMALMFARTYRRLRAGDAAAVEMAKAQSGDARHDALSWYDARFRTHGMSNDQNGVDTLRHLFVLMVGLGMRESSGRHCEGRDMSADNTMSETAEAGLFQVSYDSVAGHPLLRQLIRAYAERSDYQAVFSTGVRCDADAWRDWGEGDGRDFQALTKTCPAFAVEYAGVAMRHVRTHWGPLNRKEAEVSSEWDGLLQQMQNYMDQHQACGAMSKIERGAHGASDH